MYFASRILLSLLLLFVSAGTAGAQDTSKLSLRACGNPNPGTPNHSRYQNLDAVGLAVSDTGSAMNAKPLQFDYVVDIFTKRIREQIFPFLNADANCQIPDVAVFKLGEGNNELYMKEFMSSPRRLMIVVQIRIERFSNPPKLGPWLGLVTLEYIRLDKPFLNFYQDSIQDSRHLVIPLSDPDEEIAKRMGWFADNIIVITNRQMSIDTFGTSDERMKKILEGRPIPPMIPIPTELPKLK